MTARLLMAVSICAALGVAGCGHGTGSADSDSGRLPVPRERVLRATPGSPERLVLEWWRSLQAGQTAAVLGRLTSGARKTMGTRKQRIEIAKNVGDWASHVSPTVMGSVRSGRTTTVYLRLTVNEVLGRGVTRSMRQYLALPVRRERSGPGLIEDSAWLHAQAGELAKAGHP